MRAFDLVAIAAALVINHLIRSHTMSELSDKLTAGIADLGTAIADATGRVEAKIAALQAALDASAGATDPAVQAAVDALGVDVAALKGIVPADAAPPVETPTDPAPPVDAPVDTPPVEPAPDAPTE